MPADEDKSPQRKAVKKPASKKPAAPPSSPAKPTAGTPATKPLAKAASAAQPYFSLLTEDDLFLFNEGSHFRLYEKLGCHLVDVGGVAGAYFAVWAPDAEYVSVIGEFNFYNPGEHPLKPKGASGIWEGFIPGNRTRRDVQIPYWLTLQRVPGGQSRPLCDLLRGAAQDGLSRLGPRLRVG